MLGPSSAGYFDIGHRVVIVFVSFLGVYFTNLLPAMSLTSHDSATELGQMLTRSVMLSVIPSILLAVTVMFTASLILGLIYGEMFVRSESVNAFSALIWMIPVLAARRNGRTALITINYQHVDFWISVVGIILMVSMVIPATFYHGIEGTAWAMVISELISAVITWMFLIPGLKRMTGLQDRFQQP
jgi:O-antigen/teichoic acid export membrane protein